MRPTLENKKPRRRSTAPVRSSQVAPRSELAKALGYMNAQWDALVRYAADGTLEIDNLTAERALRGIADDSDGSRPWIPI